MHGMLRKMRSDKNMTMRQVADAVEISESMYCLIENGKRRPSPDVAQRLGELLGFDWTWFYNNQTTEPDKAV